MNPDGTGIAFVDYATGALLPYFIEAGLNTTETRIWIRVPHIPANETREIHLYYGRLPREYNVPSTKRDDFEVLLLDRFVLSIDGPLGGRYSHGGHHTCVLLEDGRIACWGTNGAGQLGVGDTTNRTTPVIVANIGTTLPKAVAIALGGAHSCALLEDGRIACWGYNGYGQLGVGDTTNRYTPVIVNDIGSTLPKAVAIAAGGGHSCALLKDGRVACWGWNNNGQLGVGDTTNRTTPVIVSSIGTTLPKAVAVAAGGWHSCALLEDGRIACWGANGVGQLGNGSTTNRTTPVIVANIGTTLPKAVAVGLGLSHTCALLEDGRIACWGYNYYGQLGDGSTTNRTTPVIVRDIGITLPKL
jgi:Alpha-tubulin suppressor and related RCC1 domain-containing proteins